MPARRSQSGPWLLADTVYVPFLTYSTGAPAAPDDLPTGTLYTGPNVASADGMGVTVTVTAMTGNDGHYVASFAATTGNGFARGETYHLLLAYAISSTTYKEWVDITIG